MRIGIIGCGGQLGNALQEVLGAHQLWCADIGELDITRFQVVVDTLRKIPLDLVINAAAYTQVDAAEEDPVNAYRVNALGPRNLAIATCEKNIPLVHVSTDYVFDGRAGRAYHEFDVPNPLSVYGRTKLAGEKEVAIQNPRHYIVRTAWLYHTRGRNFAKTLIELAAKGGVRVVKDQFGSPTYAPHLAQVMLQLMETGAFGIYHLAGRGGTNWYEFTRTLFDDFNIKAPVTPVTTAEFPRPAPRPAYAVLTTLKDPEILLPPWEEGLKQFAEDMKRKTEVGQ